MKYKQDERVYFKISEDIKGYATVAGDYDLIVILKPEKPLNDYSHIYVSRTQILNYITRLTENGEYIDEKPVVNEEEEADEGL